MFLFVVTHLGSGSSMLCESLNRHPLITRGNPVFQYSHPRDFEIMKSSNYAKIHFDEVFFNYQILKPMYRCAKFIFLIRDSSAIEHMNIKRPEDYYCYRLRRIYEMAKKNPDHLLLTWNDLSSGKAYESTKEFLGVKKPLEYVFEPDTYSVNQRCQERYEKYYDLLSNIKNS